jgi:hypothetical protein
MRLGRFLVCNDAIFGRLDARERRDQMAWHAAALILFRIAADV